MTADTPAASKNVGHGKVTPRPDGVTARCFGPGVCPVCLQEEVATLTAKLEAERAKVAKIADERDSLAGELDEANEKLDFIRDIEVVLKAETARETARADAAVAEAKALREALFTIKRGHTDGDLGGATWRPLHQNEIKAIVDRATLAQPAADGGK